MGKQTNNHSVGFWEMWRDVLLKALDKGQLLPAGLLMIFTIIILKLSNDDIKEFVQQIFQGLANYSLFGYTIGTISILGWFIHIRWIKKKHHQECERIGEEKTKLQEQLMKKKPKTSK